MISSLSSPLRRPAEASAVLTIFTCLLLLWGLWTRPLSSQRVSLRGGTLAVHKLPTSESVPTSSSSITTATVIPATPSSVAHSCLTLPGAEDVFVVLKTGATEIERKLPIHLDTTFRCMPNYKIFSDLEQDISGHHIHDALDSVDASIRDHHADFELYRTIHKLVPDSISDVSRKAWNLDKWKFLPLMEKALHSRPEAKWFLFIEADTYLVWSNLLRWLRRLDHTKPWYIGGQAWVGKQIFAHGGTGFVISNPALRTLVDKRNGNVTGFDELTQKEWLGDFVLAKALLTVGIELSPSWPIFQGETPFSMDYTPQHYCFPVVSWHHMSPEWIKQLWDFEQQWINKGPNHPPMRHRDVFNHFVRPQLQPFREAWDNLSRNRHKGNTELNSTEACHKFCENNKNCIQYLYSTETGCSTDTAIRLGSAVQGVGADEVVSGWIMSRVEEFKKKMEPCRQDFIPHKPKTSR